MLDLAQSAEPAEILEVGGGYRATDNFEIAPKVERLADGSFSCSPAANSPPELARPTGAETS